MEGRGFNLNTIILTLALAGGAFWGRYVTDTLHGLEVMVSDRNDRLIRVEEALKGVQLAVQAADAQRADLEALKTRVAILERAVRR